jgi:hypothetical protein
MFKTLGPKTYREGAQEYRITAKYGIDYDFAKRNHQAPYFSITGSIDRKAQNGRWLDDAGGTLHDEIAHHFPELEPYLKWHLVSDEGPMHYLANAKYWLDVARGKTTSDGRVDPAAAFVLGALPDIPPRRGEPACPAGRPRAASADGLPATA